MYKNNIKKIRKQKGYTQEELAEKAGVHRHEISRWENGEHIPQFPAMIKLRNALDTTIDDLFVKGCYHETN